MQTITRKKVFVAISLMALTAGLYGYMEYTRDNKDLIYAKADHVTRVHEFVNEFEEDEKEANEKFIDKIIAVNGSVKDVVKDDDEFYTIVLGDGSGTSSVRCSMDADHQLEAVLLKLRSNVTIKGVCTGFNADDLLGSDVILNRCVIQKGGSE